MKSIENYIDTSKKRYKFDAYTNVCHKYMDLNDYDNLGTNENNSDSQKRKRFFTLFDNRQNI